MTTVGMALYVLLVCMSYIFQQLLQLQAVEMMYVALQASEHNYYKLCCVRLHVSAQVYIVN